jgi:hypothetical protein
MRKFRLKTPAWVSSPEKKSTWQPRPFEKLRGAYPDSPNPAFGLAFSRLRQNQPEKALNLPDQPTLGWSQMEPHHRVIYAAILAGNNQFRDARLQAEKLARKQLRPLEQKLVADMQSVWRPPQSQVAETTGNEIPRKSNKRLIVSSIRLFGQLAPAVTPTVTFSLGGNQFDVWISREMC